MTSSGLFHKQTEWMRFQEKGRVFVGEGSGNEEIDFCRGGCLFIEDGM